MLVKAFLHWELEYSLEAHAKIPTFAFWKMKMAEGPERVFVSEHEFEVAIPPNFDPLPRVVSSLREEKKKILAEAHVKAQNIEDQIQRFLAIEQK